MRSPVPRRTDSSTSPRPRAMPPGCRPPPRARQCRVAPTTALCPHVRRSAGEPALRCRRRVLPGAVVRSGRLRTARRSVCARRSRAGAAVPGRRGRSGRGAGEPPRADRVARHGHGDPCRPRAVDAGRLRKSVEGDGTARGSGDADRVDPGTGDAPRPPDPQRGPARKPAADARTRAGRRPGGSAALPGDRVRRLPRDARSSRVHANNRDAGTGVRRGDVSSRTFSRRNVRVRRDSLGAIPRSPSRSNWRSRWASWPRRR
ncbi:hypothetical protein RFUL19S_05247 [Rhizobacter fulvus]